MVCLHAQSSIGYQSILEVFMRTPLSSLFNSITTQPSNKRPLPSAVGKKTCRAAGQAHGTMKKTAERFRQNGGFPYMKQLTDQSPGLRRFAPKRWSSKMSTISDSVIAEGNLYEAGGLERSCGEKVYDESEAERVKLPPGWFMTRALSSRLHGNISGCR